MKNPRAETENATKLFQKSKVLSLLMEQPSPFRFLSTVVVPVPVTNECI